MKERKLKKFVIPTVYTIAIVALLASVFLIDQVIDKLNDNDVNSYVINTLLDDETTQVMNVTNKSVVKPYTSEEVTVLKTFYDKDATEEEQQNSIIYYENAYMQCTGEFYTSDNVFDIVAVLDGTVSDIKEDELLGKVIEIEHENDFKTIYQSVDNIKVNIGDNVKQGDIIATSGSNLIDLDHTNSLLFEVYKSGQLMNPQQFYEVDLEALEN